MVHQVTKSGISLFLMGCAGYAFGHIAEMDPQVTAVVWLVAEVSKQAFDLLFLYFGAQADNAEALRGAACLAVPFALEKLNQVHSLASGILSFCVFSFSLVAVDSLSLFGDKDVKVVAGPQAVEAKG